MQQDQSNTFYKIGLMVGVSRYRNKGGRRGGVEVAEVADVEEVVEAGVFGPSHRRRHPWPPGARRQDRPGSRGQARVCPSQAVRDELSSSQELLLLLRALLSRDDSCLATLRGLLRARGRARAYGH